MWKASSSPPFPLSNLHIKANQNMCKCWLVITMSSGVPCARSTSIRMWMFVAIASRDQSRKSKKAFFMFRIARFSRGENDSGKGATKWTHSDYNSFASVRYRKSLTQIGSRTINLKSENIPSIPLNLRLVHESNEEGNGQKENRGKGRKVLSAVPTWILMTGKKCVAFQQNFSLGISAEYQPCWFA